MRGRQIRCLNLFFAILIQPWAAGGQSTDWAKLHAQDDATWAARSGLSQAEVHQLRSVVGVSDDSSDFIDNIDAKTLQHQGLVLFAAYSGSARCVSFWLLSKTEGSYKEDWKSEDAGDGVNLCADPMCDTPLVKAKPNRNLEIEIPSRHGGRCVSGSYGLLEWTGSTYSYRGILTTGNARRTK